MALARQQLKRVVLTLKKAGMDPLLIKGWAIGRLYPEPALRQWTDIDLICEPDQGAAARQLLGATEPLDVDLHEGWQHLADLMGARPAQFPEQFMERSEIIPLGSTTVRVLGAEDQLRLLCRHFLNHGGWRTIWLCDIAVALESLPRAFDWDYLLSGASRRAVLWTTGLAGRLLGARLTGTPLERAPAHLPGWLEPSLLAQWGSDYSPPGQLDRIPRHPVWIARELWRHWPNAIQATFATDFPDDRIPRLPLQLLVYLQRGTAFARRGWKSPSPQR